MDEWTDGQKGGWTDKRADGWTDRHSTHFIRSSEKDDLNTTQPIKIKFPGYFYEHIIHYDLKFHSEIYSRSMNNTFMDGQVVNCF